MSAQKQELIQFRNCLLVRNHSLVKEDLWVRCGKIVNPELIFFNERILADKQYDCGNAIISAGFIDLQINGGHGVDFSDHSNKVEDGVNKVAAELVKNGVTSFCPTIVTSSTQNYKSIIPRIPKTTINGAGIIGIHLEGPFISIDKKGAHSLDYIKAIENGVASMLDVYGSLENVKIITLAPEADVKQTAINELSRMGITVALGHSASNLKGGITAVENGATLITHLFNAMLPFHHRDPGLIGLLAGKNVFFGIIADGVHTHPAALQIAYQVHPNGLVLVTDAISAMGLTEGIHHIGTFEIEVREGRAFLANTDTLCGSVATMDECVRILKNSTDCTVPYALEAATLHPAQCLKVTNEKGTLDFGTDADFILLDDDLNVLSSWIAGVCVYEKHALAV